MKIAIKSVVSVHYVLSDEHGNELDSTRGREPLTYLHGSGSLFKGLELALLGAQAGDQISATLTPDQAYGEFIEELVQRVPVSVFTEDFEPEVGMRFNAQTPQGPLSVVITAIVGDEAILNGNHPLAGKTLSYNMTVDAIREATDEELSTGQVHSADNCCGHSHHH